MRAARWTPEAGVERSARGWPGPSPLCHPQVHAPPCARWASPGCRSGCPWCRTPGWRSRAPSPPPGRPAGAQGGRRGQVALRGWRTLRRKKARDRAHATHQSRTRDLLTTPARPRPRPAASRGPPTVRSTKGVGMTIRMISPQAATSRMSLEARSEAGSLNPCAGGRRGCQARGAWGLLRSNAPMASLPRPVGKRC